MSQLTTLAPAPVLSSQAPFIYNSVTDQSPTSFMTLDSSAMHFAGNQSQPLMQMQLEAQPQQPSLIPSSVVMQNVDIGRIDNTNSMSHHNHNSMSMPPPLVVSEPSNQTGLPFQLANQDVSGVSNLTHLNVTNMNMGAIAPAIPSNSFPMNGVHNMMLSNARVQTHLPPIGLLPQTPHHPVAEFLYQLTKMLTDDNTQVIEWTAGRICVHNPQKLADTVLHKYFRHSKYASFQRQLNYFGFRKIAGKGKMSPCSYVNDAATLDLRSLLFIKRKTSSSAAKKNPDKSRDSEEEAKGGGISPTTSMESCTGKKRSLEYATDQESIAKRADSKNIQNLNDSYNYMNPSNASPLISGATQVDANSVLPPAEVSSNKVHFQLQNQQTQSISQVQVQIIPRTQNLQNPLQTQQTAIPSQSQNKATSQNQNINSSNTVAQFPFNEQLHFPSEKSLAMLARPTYGIPSPGLSAQSQVSSTPSLMGSEDSYPATRAMNELNVINKDMLFDSSMVLWQNKNSGPQTLDAAPGSVDLNSFKNSDGILPSWDALFPDSVTSQNSCPPVAAKVVSDEGYPNTMEVVDTNSMLSRDSSLVDLAMLPTLSMLDMYCNNTNNSDMDISQIKAEPFSHSECPIDQIGGGVIG